MAVHDRTGLTNKGNDINKEKQIKLLHSLMILILCDAKSYVCLDATESVYVSFEKTFREQAEPLKTKNRVWLDLSIQRILSM